MARRNPAAVALGCRGGSKSSDATRRAASRTPSGPGGHRVTSQLTSGDECVPASRPTA